MVFRNLKLTYFIVFALLVSFLLPTAITGHVFTKSEKESQLAQLNKTHKQMLDVLSAGMKTPLWEMRKDSALEVAMPIINDKRVVLLRIYDSDHETIFYEYINEDGRLEGENLTGKRDIKNQDVVIGEVELVISTENMRKALQNSINTF